MTTQKVTFEKPVHKATNSALIVEVGDSVVLLFANDGEDPSPNTVVLTHVENGGKTIGWDKAVDDFYSSEVVRVDARHTYSCANSTPAACDLAWTHAVPGSGVNAWTDITGITYAGTPVVLTTPIPVPITDLQAAEETLQAAFEDAGGAGFLTITDGGDETLKIYVTDTCATTGQIVVDGNNATPAADTLVFSVAA